MSEQKIKILMVEDDPFFSRLCGRALENEGFNVVLASNGELGLEAAEKEDPDLILLDIMLPRMNGFEVLAGIRSNSNSKVAAKPIIILSNLYAKEEEEKSRKLRADGYLIKANTTSEELVTKIREILAEKQNK